MTERFSKFKMWACQHNGERSPNMLIIETCVCVCVVQRGTEDRMTSSRPIC